MNRILATLFLLGLSHLSAQDLVFPLWHFSPSPENTTGTLTSVHGLEMVPGSKLIIKADDRGHADLLTIQHAGLDIDPDSCVEVVPLGKNFPPCSRFTIVSSEMPLQGQFAGVCLKNHDHFQAALVHTPHEIQLILSPLYYRTHVCPGNIYQIAHYIDDTPMPSCFFENVFCTLDALDGCNLEKTLLQMQFSQFGALALANQNALINVRSTFSHRLQELYTATCATLPKFCLWLEPFVNQTHQGAQKGELGYRQSLRGGILGFDARFKEHLTLGIGCGGTTSSLSWQNAGGHGTTRSGYLGLYSSWLTPRYAVDGAVIGSLNHDHAHRNIPFINKHPTHSNGGKGLLGQLGLSLFLPLRSIQFQPLARAEYIYTRKPTFKEKNGNELNLKVKAKQFQLVRTELGVVASRCMAKENTIIPEVGLSWVLETRLNPSRWRGRFLDRCDYFRIDVLNPNRNLIAPTAALTGIFFKEQITLSLRYTGEYGSHLSANSISGQLDWNF